MTATILDGKATRNAIFEDLRTRVSALAERGIVPGLGTVLVGDDPGSHSYVRGKHNACAKVGITSIRRDLPADITQAELEAVIDELNADPACTGYLIQLPLPGHLDSGRRAGACRPGQGLRRPAPDEPRQAGPGRDGPAAVHAAGHHRAAQALRRAPRRRQRHGRRPWRDGRPAARPAADPPLRERHGHPVPHRHQGPGRRGPPRGHRRRRRRQPGTDHPGHDQAGRGGPGRGHHSH